MREQARSAPTPGQVQPLRSSDEKQSRLSALRADCEHCFGLCCVALPFAASSDFAINKEAGRPCPHLQENCRCGVHSGLRERGFRGCTVYDCFGAGQKITQVTFAGQDWRKAPETASRMFEMLPVMRLLHELMWYLNEALSLEMETALDVRAELGLLLDKTGRLSNLGPDVLLKLDAAAHRDKVNAALLKASELARQSLPEPKPQPGAKAADGRSGNGRSVSGPSRKHGMGANSGRSQKYGPGANFRGANLIGAKLKGADLRGSSLRGACLIAADLSGADLRRADWTGADLRDTQLAGADLSGSLFLTQAQLNAAQGDASTRLPPSLRHPQHWTH